MSFQPKMQGNLAAHPMAGGGGLPKTSVAAPFHALRNSAMAPRAGHGLRPSAGPPPHVAGAPMQLMSSGRPAAAYGHPGAMLPGAGPVPPRGGSLPGGGIPPGLPM